MQDYKIEYKLLDPCLGAGWVEATAGIELHNISFTRGHVRINGIVYTEDSKEFRDAFTKAKFWMTLKE